MPLPIIATEITAVLFSLSLFRKIKFFVSAYILMPRPFWGSPFFIQAVCGRHSPLNHQYYYTPARLGTWPHACHFPVEMTGPILPISLFLSFSFYSIQYMWWWGYCHMPVHIYMMLSASLSAGSPAVRSCFHFPSRYGCSIPACGRFRTA